MKRCVFLLLPLLCLIGCAACLDDEELVKLECVPGHQQLCDEEGDDYPDARIYPKPVRSGQCSYGLRTCTLQGWSECVGALGPEEEVCDGIDNNCDGAIDNTFPEQQQLCGFVEGVDYGVGICVPGVMVCDNGATRCEGHIGPTEEVCDGMDNNCDGSIDEGIPNSTAIVCYDGPAGTMAIGECRAGIRYCAEGAFNGPCDGQVLPTLELCDNKDNNCDGQVDEGFDNRGVDIVFVIDVSGSFSDEIESMIEGITPLLDDPLTTRFRFGLAVIGRSDHGPFEPIFNRYSQKITDFVPADEFLQYLQSIQSLSDGGIEPSIDVPMWCMNGIYEFSWDIAGQKVIILMTDEIAQSVDNQNVHQVNNYAAQNGFEVFVFALPEHHASFIGMVRGDQDRLFTPAVNSETVFLQIRQIFENLCIGRPN